LGRLACSRYPRIAVLPNGIGFDRLEAGLFEHLVEAGFQDRREEGFVAVVGVPVEDNRMEQWHCAEGGRIGDHDIGPRLHDAEHLREQGTVHLGWHLMVQRVGDHAIIALIGFAGLGGVALAQMDRNIERASHLVAALQQCAGEVGPMKLGLREDTVHGAQRGETAAARHRVINSSNSSMSLESM